MQIISESDFRKQIKADTKGAYLFFGDEDYLKPHAVKALKTAMGIDEALEIFNFVKLDVLDYTPDRLIDALSLPPMMAERKLVVLSGINTTKLRPDEVTDLIDAINHIEEFDYNTFVLSLPFECIDEGYLPKSPSSMLKRLGEILTPVRFERSTPQRLSAWAQKHFAHEGVSISPEDCTCLVDYCGKNMYTLSCEIEKLALYAKAHGKEKVEKQDIFEVCCAAVEYDTFEFANAILSNRRADALKTLSAMKFKQVEPIAIMGELSRIYCDLVNTKLLLLAGKGLADISPLFNRSEYRAKLYMKTASLWELDALKRLLGMCCEADAQMKLSYNSYSALEKLICSI